MRGARRRSTHARSAEAVATSQYRRFECALALRALVRRGARGPGHLGDGDAKLLRVDQRVVPRQRCLCLREDGRFRRLAGAAASKLLELEERAVEGRETGRVFKRRWLARS